MKVKYQLYIIIPVVNVSLNTIRIIAFNPGTGVEYTRKNVVLEESPAAIMKGVLNEELILWGRSINVESVP